MTPNDSHHRYAMAALDRGFDVICDKPMTNTLGRGPGHRGQGRCHRAGLLPDAQLHRLPDGPPGPRAVEDGQVGEIRLVQVEYVQGGKADESDPDPAGGLPWRYDPVRGGPSLVMGDIGTHAHNLARFVSRLEVAEVAPQIGHVIPNRLVDDYGGAMLRFDNGARGTFWVTQTAAGVENCLRLRVSAPRAAWSGDQERPTRLVFKPLDGPVRVYTPNGPGSLPAATRPAGSSPDTRKGSPRRSPTSIRTRRRRSPPGARAMPRPAGAPVPHRTRRGHRREVRRGRGRVEPRRRPLDRRQASLEEKPDAGPQGDRISGGAGPDRAGRGPA